MLAEWINLLSLRIKTLLRRRRLDRDLEEELGFHLAMRQERYEASGQTSEDAAMAARRRFGNVTGLKEACREAWTFSWLENLAQDVRYGLRQLRRSPGFAAVAVITLALGIGANTAIFSVLNALALRPLAVPAPSHLVEFYTAHSASGWSGITIPRLEKIAHHESVFTGAFGEDYPNNSYVEVNGATCRINLGYVTGKYYSVLGVRPLLGRLIAPDDVGLSQGIPTPVAVLGYEFWSRHFGGSKDVIGKNISVAGKPFTVIGVSPKCFFGILVGFSVDVTIPVTEEPGPKTVPRGPLWVRYAVARLRKGVTVTQARAQLETLWPAIRSETVVNARSHTLQLLVKQFPPDGESYLRQRFRKPLYVVVAIAGLSLLISCVNLASMLFARGSAREREMAIRAALGAGRGRLMRQLLTESLLLAAGGAALGCAFADRAGGLLVAFWRHIPFNPVTVLNVSPDLRVLGFATVVTLVTAVLFGLGPAWYASHRPPAGAMQDVARGSGRRFHRSGKVLIVGQVALSVVLVMAGGLLVRSFEKLRTFDPGFDYHHVAFVQLEPRVGGGKINDETYCRTLMRQFSNLPGVRSVALSQMLPGLGFGTATQRAAPSVSSSDAGVQANPQTVSPGYFRTLDIPLLRGRDFSPEDNEHSPPVAIISRSLAQRLFPSGDAIGNHILFGTESKQQRRTIVGIVGDARIPDLQTPWPYIVYAPYFQNPAGTGSWTNILMRVAYTSPGLFQAASERVRLLGREYVLISGPADQLIDTGLAEQRAMAYVAGFFLALALLLAAVGLYGLMAYTVVQRTREIGIRMALGAQQSRVLRTILAEGLWLDLGGLAVGLPCALASAHLLAHMLFGVSSYDPLTLAAVVSVLVMVGLVAGYLPARRAARVDPMVALRHE
jgi:predicted permease